MLESLLVGGAGSHTVLRGHCCQSLASQRCYLAPVYVILGHGRWRWVSEPGGDAPEYVGSCTVALTTAGTHL